MLVGEELAGAAEPALHLVADEQRAVLVQQGRGRGEEAVRRHVHALALDGLDDEGRDVSPAEFGGEGVEVAEGDRRVRQQRVEAAAELGRAVDGQRPGGQPVEGVVAVDDAAAPGGVPGELQRGLDRLGAAVAEEHPVKTWRLGEEALREQAGQRAAVELGPVGQLGVQRVVQRLADHRVVAPGREHAEPGQEVRVLVAVGVVQVGALGPLVDLVEADRVQHLRLLRVQVPAVQLVTVIAVGGEQGLQVEVHGSFCPGRGGAFRGRVRLPDTRVGLAVQPARAGEEAGGQPWRGRRRAGREGSQPGQAG